MTNCIVGQFTPPTRDEIRAHLREYPLKEMLRRGWIQGDIKSDESMYAALARFFGHEREG